MRRDCFPLVIAPRSHTMRLDNLRRRFGGDLCVPEAETTSSVPSKVPPQRDASSKRKQASKHSLTNITTPIGPSTTAYQITLKPAISLLGDP
jgi:hypothetical protein